MFSFAIALQKPEAQIVWKMKMPDRRVGRRTFYLFYAAFVQIEHFILRFLAECKSKSFAFQSCSSHVDIQLGFYMIRFLNFDLPKFYFSLPEDIITESGHSRENS